MKKTITLFLIILINTNFFAQTDTNSGNKQNVVNEQIKEISDSNTSTNKDSNYANYVFNVKFHVVKNDDGTGATQNIGEDQMMNAMRILNTTFNPFRMYFKYRGFDAIHSTLYNSVTSSYCQGTNCPANTFGHLVLDSWQTTMPPNTSPVYSWDAINIFIVSNIDKNITTGISQKVGCQSNYSIGITHDYFLTNILVREMAHYFMLQNIEDIWRYYPPPYNTPCELVNGTNGYTTGDGISDTPATPWPLTISNFGSNCTYVSTGGANSLDCTGVPYINVPVNNFMIDVVNNCNTLGPNFEPVAGLGRFTNGQIDKMRTNIAQVVFAPGITTPIENTMTTLESLYQPYSVTTLPNGTKQHKFQKGFSYWFANAALTALPALSATTSVAPIISNITANYNVRILQVNTNIYNWDYQLVPLSFVPTTIMTTIAGNSPFLKAGIPDAVMVNKMKNIKNLNGNENFTIKKNVSDK